MNKFPKKVYFQSKSEKKKTNITIEFFIFKLVLVPIFSLYWQLRYFGPNLPTKGSYFQSKTDKLNIAIEFCIFELVFVSNFTSKKFKFLDQIYQRKIFIFKNRKSEYHHWIPRIQISLVTKFQFKLTTLIFLSRFTQKKFFWSKTVNTTYFLHNSAYSNTSSAKFQLQLIILFFWIIFAQKGISSRKQNKRTSPWNSAYLNYSRYKISA